MIITNKKQRINTLTLSAISMSALLALSACSGDNKVVEESAKVNDSTDTSVAVEEAPVAERAVVEEAVKEEATAETEVLAADAGAKLYESNCKVCHDAGLLNAPKYGDTAAWSARLTKGKETLYTHSAKGFNKMPAQAVEGITEVQVKDAVDYMLASVS